MVESILQNTKSEKACTEDTDKTSSRPQFTGGLHT